MKKIILGRADDCDYVINDAKVSRIHAEIIWDNSKAYIRDLESSNGTYINGNKIDGKTILKSGDQLHLGGREIEWETLIDQPKTSENKKSINSKIKIGRSPDNDVVFNFPNISRFHAELFKTEQGKWKIRDLDSTFGTYIRDLDSQVIGEKVVEDEEVIYLATYKTTVKKIVSRCEDRKTISEVKPSKPRKKITIGRGSSNKHQIDNPLISREHAVIYKENECWFIKDLNSTNGTWVEGEKITSKPVKMKHRSVISVGPVQIIFQPKTGELITDRPGEIRIDLIKTRREVPNMFGYGNVRLVDDVSLSVYPGEMMGILGPSGAGKSELMKLMCRYNKPTTGNVFFNGQDIQKNYGSFRQKIGYVPQDEIIHPELKVEEALEYSARLRLPRDTTEKEIRKAVNTTLDTLGLLEHRDKIIGSPETGKILSGGQRKRVNIGIELIAHPEVIFLDEPTSGLSIKDSEVVMDHLRQLADNGTTVIQILHSPPTFLYRLLDQVTWMLPGGRIAFYGPPDPGSYDFFETEENMPGMIEKRLADSKPAQLQKKYCESEYHQRYVEQRQSNIEPKNENKISEARPVFDFKKFLIYMERYFKIRRRDTWNFLTSLTLPVLITVALAILFGGDATDDPLNFAALLFFLAISSLWLGCAAAAQEIVSERTVFEREKMVNLRIFPYVASKLVVLGAFAALQTVVLILGPLAVANVAGGEQFFIVFIILMLTNLTGISLGLFISSIVRTPAFAATLVPLVLIPCVIFAGLAPNLGAANELAVAIAHLTPSRYAFGALLSIEGQFYDLPYGIADMYKNLVDFMGFSLEYEAGDQGWLIGVFALAVFIIISVTATVFKLKKPSGEN